MPVLRPKPAPAMESEADQPPRSIVIRWLRINLALTVVMVSAASTGIGMLVSGTWRVANYEFKLTQQEHTNSSIDARLVALETINRDQIERRMQWVQDKGVISSRLGTLEDHYNSLLGRPNGGHQ